MVRGGKIINTYLFSQVGSLFMKGCQSTFIVFKLICDLLRKHMNQILIHKDKEV